MSENLPPSGGRLRGRRRKVVGVATATVASLTGAMLLGPGSGNASSHREAPLVAADPQIDTTDVYAFVSPEKDGTVTLIANWIPFEVPAGGPNFYAFSKDANYDINIDNNGDGRADLSYRWVFHNSYRNPNTFLYNTGPVTALDDPDLNFRQTYDLKLIAGGHTQTLAAGLPVAPSNVGKASMPNYASLRSAAVRSLGGASKTFAGQADDPFFLDLRVFDLLYGGNLSEVGNDTVKGYSVNTVALKVPMALLAARHNATRNPVIGVWSTTSRRSMKVSNPDGRVSFSGPFVSVSRLGSPLVNEVVIPVGQKDRFNASAPVNDAQFGKYVLDPEVPKLIQSIYGIPAPKTPRSDLAAVFLTGVPGLTASSLNRDHAPTLVASEMLRLNMSIPPTAKPNRLGVLAGDKAGFPNGRRLADDVLDIELRALEGALLPGHPAVVDTLGDAVNANDVPFGSVFPYLALPRSG